MIPLSRLFPNENQSVIAIKLKEAIATILNLVK
jgi:hypothetical protein